MTTTSTRTTTLADFLLASINLAQEVAQSNIRAVMETSESGSEHGHKRPPLLTAKKVKTTAKNKIKKRRKVKAWTKAEKDLLLELTKDGKSIQHRCRVLRRTPSSIYAQLQGLKHRPKKVSRKISPPKIWEATKFKEPKTSGSLKVVGG